MKSKFKFLLLLGAFILGSIYFTNYARSKNVELTNSIVLSFTNFITSAKDKINEHFFQASQIRDLREQNKELERSATLLSTFAFELNSILMDKNSSLYEPKIQLTRALTYANIGDYGKFWLDFEIKDDKIHGLIYQGKSAGILTQKNGKALGILQTDKDCVFSVFIGDEKIAGIAKGNQKNIIIKYISQWLNPKIGDEVYTSGLDGVFFAGVPVGKVVEIKNQDLYKSAVVEPYIRVEIPSYLYVVTKER